jgi:hypothetical protein
MRTEQFEEVINNRKETQENAAEIETGRTMQGRISIG